MPSSLSLAEPLDARAVSWSQVGVAQPRIVRPTDGSEVRFRVAALDLGMKRSMVTDLVALGAEVHLLPCATARCRSARSRWTGCSSPTAR
jgi:carbamoylphosphate synthase small subunit